eukprot:TRINITY_DN451_c0_g1_i14.p1 TRINITY_DN451_c0_g1~~TRINITY_DN451_c0_g1_i14.p1  ORF type:complete len:190 (-),score=14.16 TRINITY_DN451_c0_g1_i14:1795-2364(-)
MVCGYCVCCRRRSSPQYHPSNERTDCYRKTDLPERYDKANRVCHSCFIDLKADEPSVKRSDIPRAGNGLFADRDYKWGETITYYNGKIYTDRSKVPASCAYVLYRGGFFIDGRVKFGSRGKGRYINGTLKGQRPNVYFGSLDIGFEVPIKVITRSEATKRGISKKRTIGLRKGEELVISYGTGYWKRVK